MTPLTIEQILALPYVSLEDANMLPRKGGIYCFIAGRQSVIYVGATVQPIRTRWFGHHHRAAVEAIADITIAYLTDVESNELTALERATIAALEPELNITGVSLAVRRSRLPENKPKRSFALDHDVMAWLERTARERRTNVNALANQIIAAEMEREQRVKRVAS